MTDHEAELFAVIYRLGALIHAKNWPEALACWEWLLNAYSPLATIQPDIRTVLKRNVALIALAERQAPKVIH